MSPRPIEAMTGAPGLVSTKRMSVNPSARRSSSAIYWGATQTPPMRASRTCVVSSRSSAATAWLRGRRAAAAVTDRPEMKSRRVCFSLTSNLSVARFRSRLQLASQLVEEAPIGAVGDQLLRVRFDEADIMQAQSIEAHRVLGIVVAPFEVIIAQRL